MGNQNSAQIMPRKGMFGGNYMAMPEILPGDSRWDSVLVAGNAALANQFNFFVVPLNQVGSGFARTKTIRETNMTTAGKLAPTDGTVKAIFVTLTPKGTGPLTAATNQYLMTFMDDSILSFRVNDNDVVGVRPLNRYNGYGIAGFVSQTIAPDVSIASGTVTPLMGYYQLAQSVSLPANTGFTVSILPNSSNTFIQNVPLGSDFMITVYLVGEFGRIAVL